MSEFKLGDKVNIYCNTFTTQGNVCEGTVDCLDNSGDMIRVHFKMKGEYSDARWFHVKQLELIERPKPKVKLYQYAYFDNGRWFYSNGFYRDEKHVHEVNEVDGKSVKRLDHTMIEVDDE